MVKYKNYEIKSSYADSGYIIYINDFIIENKENGQVRFPTKEIGIDYAKEIIDNLPQRNFKYNYSTYIQRLTQNRYIIGERTTYNDGMFFQKQKDSATWYWIPLGLNSLNFPKNYEVKYSNVIAYEKDGKLIKKPINGKWK